MHDCQRSCAANPAALAEGAFDGVSVSEELPLEVPDCFNRGDFNLMDTSASLSLSGCALNYHPWSGRRLSAEKSRALSQASIVVDGSAAPDPSPEAVREVMERKSSPRRRTWCDWPAASRSNVDLQDKFLGAFRTPELRCGAVELQ